MYYTLIISRGIHLRVVNARFTKNEVGTWKEKPKGYTILYVTQSQRDSIFVMRDALPNHGRYRQQSSTSAQRAWSVIAASNNLGLTQVLSLRREDVKV